jgi:hypothetical protein
MLRTQTNLHYANCAADSHAKAPMHDCDTCGHKMALFRVVFSNGTVHFASRCRCGHRYWPQTIATEVYWRDAPLVPSKKSTRRRQAEQVCRALAASEAFDAACQQAAERDQ